jgi:hypothetical protein
MDSPDWWDGCPEIKDSIGPLSGVKEGAPWGFVMYRCSYKDNESWHQMVAKILNFVKRSGNLRYHKSDIDLLSRHSLVLMNDKVKFDGATSHKIRDHFSSWVADEFQRQLDTDVVVDFDPEQIKQNPMSVPPGRPRCSTVRGMIFVSLWTTSVLSRWSIGVTLL